MNGIDSQYQALLYHIKLNGTKKETRNGPVISTFGRQIRHNMAEGFPLLTTKKMYWKGIVAELLWFLKGQTDIRELWKNDCHIWDGDAYKNYLHKVIRDKDIVRYLKSYSIDTKGVPTIEPYIKDEFIERIKNDDEFAKKWGELGPIYGKQWRKWGGIIRRAVEFDTESYAPTKFEDQRVNDQIANLINDLKTNPDSRRLMVSAWNVTELDSMVLPPCHYGFQVYTRELSDEERIKLFIKLENPKGYEGERITHTVQERLNMNNIPKRALSLMWNQRSVDVPLGLPFNIASYGLLLSIIAEITNMVPDQLIGSLGDCHIYENQIEGVEEQLKRNGLPLPKLKINTEFWPTQSGECGVGPLVDNVDWLIRGMEIDDFKIENYESYPAIKMPLSN